MMFHPFRWICAIVFVFFVVLSVACGDSHDDAIVNSPDGEHEASFAGGKADSFVGACEAEHVLLLVNDPGRDEDTLVNHGIHRRAARNIAAFRAGSDEILGTHDDRYFHTIEDVDDVPYVGPVAMQQLIASIATYCTDERPWRQSQTLFSPLPYYESHLTHAVEAFASAQHSIDIAMYSLSDSRSIAALVEAAVRGVKVRMLFNGANGEHLRPEGTRSAQLEELGVDVRYINRVMHHKFAIIDGPQRDLLHASTARFFSGSANLSFGAATRYDENITFHQGDAPLVLMMQEEFNHLWENSRDFIWNDEIEYFETMPIVREMIPPQDDLEVLLTSENFETTYSTRWGAGFSPRPFSQVVADRLIELIANAQSSIYVAASFLRSRGVSEALIEKWRGNPEIDIRLYLDQSEYISAWYHRNQQRELESCLEEAESDEADIFACRERGFLFSYQLHSEEVPVRFKNYSYRWHYSYATQMHHKYMIFDRQTVATGSYNFSNNAEQNTMENVFIYHHSRYPNLVDAFVENFEDIWITGHAEQRFESLMAEITTTDEIDLVFDPVALTWDETTELRRTIRDLCPDVDSEPYRTKPEDHRTCTVQ